MASNKKRKFAEYNNIKKSLLRNNNLKRLKVLKDILYEKNIDYSTELNELLSCKLIVKYQNKYKVKNIFYEHRFNKFWIEYKILLLTINQKIFNKNYTRYFIVIILVSMILISFAIVSTKYSDSLFESAKNKSERVLKKIEEEQAINNEDLYSLEKSLLKLERGLFLKSIADNNLQEFPTVKPIHALGDVLNNNNVYIRREIDEYDHPIRDISIDSKGNRLTVAGEDEHLSIYSLEKMPIMAEKTEFKKESIDKKGTVTSLSFYPDNNLLAYAIKNQPKKIFIHNFNSDSEEYLTTDNGEISNITFSQDGEYIFYLLTKSSSKKGKLFEIEKRREKLSLSSNNLLDSIQNDDEITDISFSSDGNYISTINNKDKDNKYICIRNLKSPDLSIARCFSNIDIDIDTVLKVKFTPWGFFGDYSFFTMEEKEQKIVLKLWSYLKDKIPYTNLEKIAEFEYPDIQSFNFHPTKAHLFTVQKRGKGNKNKITFWNLSRMQDIESNKKELVLEEGSKIKIEQIKRSFSTEATDNTKRLIFLNRDLTYNVINIETGAIETNTYKEDFGLPDKIKDLSILPNFKSPQNNKLAVIDKIGKLLLCTEAGGCMSSNNFEQIDINNYPKIKTFKSSRNYKFLVVIVEDVEERTKNYFYNVKSGTSFSLNNYNDIENADVSPDGNNIAFLQHGKASLYEYEKEEEFDLATGVKDLLFSPKEKYLALDTNEGIELITAEENFKSENNISIPKSENTIKFAFSNDDEYLAIIQNSNKKSVKIRKLSQPESEWIEVISTDDLDTDVSLIFNPYKVENSSNIKANLFVTVEKGRIIRLWNIRNNEVRQIRTFYADKNIISDGIKFSTNGQYLVAIEENNSGELAFQYWDLDKSLSLEKLRKELENLLKD